MLYTFTVLFCAFLTDCHDSTCAFLIVMLILLYALFYSTCVYLSVCNAVISMYASTVFVLLLLLCFLFFCCCLWLLLFLFILSWLFVMLILMYEFIVLMLFFLNCQVDFDVDNVQRRELVNIYGSKGALYKSYYNNIYLPHSCYQISKTQSLKRGFK